jgi:rod shape-determining protein MreD
MAKSSISVKPNSFAGWLRLAVPQIFLFVFLILNLISIPLITQGTLKPAFVLMAVYYWAIFRPNLVPSWLCFAYGIILDVMVGLPVGLTAFILVAMQWIVRDQRRFLMGQPFIVVWAIFILIYASTQGLAWLLNGFAYDFVPLKPLLLNIGFNAILYPFISLLLVTMHRLLPVAQRSFT